MEKGIVPEGRSKECIKVAKSIDSGHFGQQPRLLDLGLKAFSCVSDHGLLAGNAATSTDTCYWH